MTSSLVGSEMCIRDSFSRFPAAQNPEGFPLRVVTEPWFSRHSCLFEAVATFMGFHQQRGPISKMRRHCAEQLKAY
eukprot:2575679-Prorocentrum_lima.AAC.1